MANLSDVLWTGFHQRGGVADITVSLHGLARLDILDVIVAMRKHVDAELEFWLTMKDDPEYDANEPEKLTLTHFQFSDEELTVILDAKDAPITASTMPITVGPEGILPLQIGIRADTPKGSVPLLRGTLYLEGGVVPSRHENESGGVGVALLRAMKKELLEEIRKALPPTMYAEEFVINEAFLTNGGMFTLANSAETEPLAVFIPTLPFQQQGQGYWINPDNDKELVISDQLLQMTKSISQRQQRLEGLLSADWSVMAKVSYRIKEEVNV